MSIVEVEMPVLELDEERVLNEAELRWVQFLRDLEPWEIHKLHTHGQEMFFHDAYLSGEITLMDIFSKICIEGEEQRFSTKV